jgi:vacuolar-type H+-ATPase subunit I/STV1
MKTLLTVLFIIGLIAIVFAIMFGFSFIVYWIVLKAGAPKYVAVIVGVAVFCIGGWVANLKS